jgi:hypothetical protein
MSLLIDQFQWSGDLFTQYIANRQDQVATEVIGSFPVWIFDSVVTSTVTKVSVLEFAVAVLNDFSAHLSAEKVVQRFGLGLAARINYHGTAVFYDTGSDRLCNAIVQSSHSQRFRGYLRVTRSAYKHKTDYC